MDKDILDILSNIKTTLKDYKKASIYRNGKLVLSTNTASTKTKLGEEMKDNFTEPSKNLKIYKITFGIFTNYKPTAFSFGPFIINCDQLTLTPDFKIKQLYEDGGQTITYTIDELKKRGFKISDFQKIMKAVKNKTISFIPNKKVTITDVINSLK